MKLCSKCNQEKPFEAFYTSKTHKSGYASWCIMCESERCRVKNLANREKRLSVAKAWRDKNKDKQTVAINNWRINNQDKLKAIYRDWAQRNKSKVNANWMKREASKKQRTPPWLTKEHKKQIEIEYALSAWCTEVMGEPYHVDHIVPLQGKTVSGLHVPWNLQVLPAKINQQKSNRLAAAGI